MQAFILEFWVKLTDWYKANKRNLPWRGPKDPYKIMISEFMLIQTTVATVIPRYEKFLKEFPTLEALARSPLWKVKRAWSGLGYYSRAVNLWKSSREIIKLRRFPRQPHELKNLPGFGPYLANAVASLAFNVRTAAIDSNVRRVLLRIFDSDDPGIPEALLANSKANSSDLNQALIELGALICQAKKPKCERCPISDFCLAKGSHISEKTRSGTRKMEILISAIQDKNNRVLLVKRGNREPFLKNGWGLPMRILKICPQNGFKTFNHSIMKWKIHAHVRKAQKARQDQQAKWVKSEDLGKYLFSSLWFKAFR